MPPETQSNPAATSEISLSEAILAPLDAMFKAQIHSSRAFINYLFQMAYPHLPVNENGTIDHDKVTDEMKKPYTIDIPFVNPDGTPGNPIKIPSLALLPVSPLGIEEADIKFSLAVEKVDSHNVIQQSENNELKKEGEQWDRSKRPWFLVDDPKSIRGTFRADSASDLKSASTIEVFIKVKKQPTPVALEKAVSALSQSIQT